MLDIFAQDESHVNTIAVWTFFGMWKIADSLLARRLFLGTRQPVSGNVPEVNREIKRGCAARTNVRN
jgi:hypothetical protein